MTDEDDEPTAEELAEAEALARALEPGAPGVTAGAPGARPPEDALAAAALLRHASRLQAPAVDAARASAGVAAAARRALPAVDARRTSRRRWRWLVPTLLAPAAAAAIVLVSMQRRPAAPASPLPGPPLALLQAQARAASGREDLAALDRQMRDYRAALYGALATRAGEER